MACSPPIDMPTSAMRSSSTSGLSTSHWIAGNVSQLPNQPKSMARPSLSPWPRASKASTPYP